MGDVLEMAEMLLRTRNTDALALVQTVEAIAAEVRELRRDKARLDWLIDNCFSYKTTGTDRLGDLVEDREDIDAAMGWEG
jgi:hypothetical protein